LTRIRNVRNTTKFKRSIKAISPVIATLLMIAIAVVASLVVYAWVMGYMGTTTTKAGRAIQIQSYAPTPATNPTNLLVYVQNVGQGDVQLSQTQSVYIDSNLVPISNPNTATIPIPVGQTVELTVPLPTGYQTGDKLEIKVTTTDGTFMTASGTGTSSSGGGSGTTAAITLSSNSGTAGSTITLTGSNFAATSAITVKFDTTTLTTTPAAVTTTAAGTIPTGVTFTIPATASAGSHTITVTDAASNYATSTYTVTSSGNSYVTTTTLAAIATPLTPGQTNVAFSGSVASSTAVPNGQPVVLQYSTSTTGPWTTAATVNTASGTGAFSGTFTAPAAGSYYFQAYFAAYTSGTNTWQTSTSSRQTIAVSALTQYTITFGSSGLGTDGSGTLVTYTVNGGSQTSIGVAGGSVTVTAGDSIHYSFQSPIASSGSPSTTRYLWSSTSGLSQTLQTNTFTASATGTITATYTTQTFGVDVSNTGFANSGTTVSVTLTNCKANDVIIVFGSANGNLPSGVTDNLGTHLTWALRDSVDQSGHQRISEYSAVFGAGGTITITMTFTADTTNGFSVVAFAISGANTATPFDTHAGLPYSAYSSTTNTAPSVGGVLTTNANDLIIGLAGSRTATTETPAGTGFALIKSVTSAVGSGAAEDEILTSPLSSSTTISFGTTISTSTWSMIVDAVQRAW
jgi:flagellin-like protein